MSKDRLQLIDRCRKIHPSAGVDKGWSYYTGGMKDSGDWYYEKLRHAPLEEIEAFVTEHEKPILPVHTCASPVVVLNGGKMWMKLEEYEAQKSWYAEMEREHLNLG